MTVPDVERRNGQLRSTPWWVWVGLATLLVIAIALVAIAIQPRVGPSAAGSPAAQDDPSPSAEVGTPSPTPDEALEVAERAAAVIDHPVLRGGCTPIADDEVNRSDDGKSVVLVSHGFGLVACVLDALDAPDAVYARMEQTRPIDGTLTAEWTNARASWTFDGIDELRVVLEYTGPDVAN